MDIKLLIAKMIGKLQRPALRNCRIDATSKVYERSELQNVVMGRHSYIGKGSIVSNAVIGSFCSIAGYGQIGGGGHPTHMVSTSPCFLSGSSASGTHFASIPYTSSETVEIGNDVWIGAGCYIRSGVHIGNGAVVGAHSVVTHDVEPYTIVAGSPARVIRRRFDDETIRKLQELAWWDWSDERIRQNAAYFENPAELLKHQ